MRATPSSRGSRAALAAVIALGLVMLAALGATGSGDGTALTRMLDDGAAPLLVATAPGTSSAGITPIRVEDGPGGNVLCSQVPLSELLSSSQRLEVRGGRLEGTLPEGVSATLADGGRSVSWSATFPMAAVIVKGGSGANVYGYSPALGADSGLVPPANAGGNVPDVSNVTFCWDPNPSTEDPDLVLLCVEAAEKAAVGPIVSVAGPIEIRGGAVVASTVPSGLQVTFDLVADEVAFVAPFPVVVAVTAASLPVVHRIDPPSTSGSVPLSSNPGDAELVLCGLDTAVVVTVSCAQVAADGEVGPVPIRDGSLDPADLPEVITRIVVEEDAVEFQATVPVVALIVEASPPKLYAFTEPVLTASVPVAIDGAADIDLVFCLGTVSGSDGVGSAATPQSADDPSATQGAADPAEIATGGGPAPRTTLLLVAFVVLALTGSSFMVSWGRGG